MLHFDIIDLTVVDGFGKRGTCTGNSHLAHIFVDDMKNISLACAQYSVRYHLLSILHSTVPSSLQWNDQRHLDY